MTLSHLLKDRLTDETSLWFSNRDHDRVTELLQNCKNGLEEAGDDLFANCQSAYKNKIHELSGVYTPFTVSTRKRRIGASGCDPRPAADNESASKYNSDELESSNNNAVQDSTASLEERTDPQETENAAKTITALSVQSPSSNSNVAQENAELGRPDP